MVLSLHLLGAVLAASRAMTLGLPDTASLVSTVAGGGLEFGDYSAGSGESVRLFRPTGIAVTADDASVYISDKDNHKLKRVSAADGSVVTLAGSGEQGAVDGVGSGASFAFPHGICLSVSGHWLFVADEWSHRVRAVLTATPEDCRVPPCV